MDFKQDSWVLEGVQQLKSHQKALHVLSVAQQLEISSRRAEAPCVEQKEREGIRADAFKAGPAALDPSHHDGRGCHTMAMGRSFPNRAVSYLCLLRTLLSVSFVRRPDDTAQTSCWLKKL